MSLSVVELIEADSMDATLAAVCWVMVERRCPLMVVGVPRFAGKTTVLEALLAFLPEDEGTVALRGMAESFGFLTNTDPAHTCIICSEISESPSFYLWGPKVVTMFRALERGYALGTTMHASSAQEAVEILRSELHVPPALLARLGLVVSLGVKQAGKATERWVHSVDTLTLRDDGDLAVVPVYRHDSLTSAHVHLFDSSGVTDVLPEKAGLTAAQFTHEVARRKAFMEAMTAGRVKDYTVVRNAILSFARHMKD